MRADEQAKTLGEENVKANAELARCKEELAVTKRGLENSVQTAQRFKEMVCAGLLPPPIVIFDAHEYACSRWCRKRSCGMICRWRLVRAARDARLWPR